MSVYETDIPGVGRKFELELRGGSRVVVVVHHDGRCELYHREDAESDGRKILDLTGDEANRLGSILEGAYFESVDVDALTVPLGDAIIEWIDVPAASPLVGTALGESEVRSETGASVIAVQRDDETVANPDSAFEVEAGDLLVAIGTREEQSALRDLVEGDD
ncbi:MAG: cation:proton antiporter regulatory subunit [Haloferacaceae archaeon]